MVPVLNGTNLRVFSDNFLNWFLVAGTVWDFLHLVAGEIEKLMRFRSSFDRSGLSPEWPAGKLILGNQFDQVRDQPLSDQLRSG